jgi:hypothetical protein
VAGHGRQISTRGGAILDELSHRPSGKEFVVEKGVITGLPGKPGDPYTVLGEQTVVAFEAQEEHLTTLS